MLRWMLMCMPRCKRLSSQCDVIRLYLTLVLWGSHFGQRCGWIVWCDFEQNLASRNLNFDRFRQTSILNREVRQIGMELSGCKAGVLMKDQRFNNCGPNRNFNSCLYSYWPLVNKNGVSWLSNQYLARLRPFAVDKTLDRRLLSWKGWFKIEHSDSATWSRV